MRMFQLLDGGGGGAMLQVLIASRFLKANRL